MPLLAGCVALAIVSPPRLSRENRTLDIALCAALAAGAVQLLPLPRAVVAAIAPGNAAVQQSLALGAVPPILSLSIDRAATARALAIFAGIVLLYWAARRTFPRGGVRRVCRAIAWLGLLMSCDAVVQLGASRGYIYGFWTPLETGAFPYGPFVNRNHAATWLVMAIPLCFGYLVARLRASGAGRRQMVDGRTVWLIASATVMLLALVMSLSRSGMVALTLAALGAAVLARAQLDRARMAWAIGAVLVGGVLVLAFADTPAVVERFGESSRGQAGRLHIWRDTAAMCRALWPAGSGIGTYQKAMVLFQTGDRTYYFNHAHNHFLQVAAEGGVLLSVPAAIALGAFVSASRRRLAAEETGLFWIQAGAATGLLAVAVQSMWDTGLRVPANAALAAVLAAIVTHHSRTSTTMSSGSQG